MDEFDPQPAGALTQFFTEKTEGFRKRPNGLDVLQLKEGYLDYACIDAPIGSAYWVSHPVSENDPEFFWVQVFEVKAPGLIQDKSPIVTEQHIVSKEQLDRLRAISSPTVLALEHSGLRKATLIGHKTSIESFRGTHGYQSAVEFNQSVNNWHVLWPLHRIALCRDDGNILIFMPSALKWLRFCTKVGVACGLDQGPLLQFVRGACREYLCALRYVHTSRFLERGWMSSVRNLIKNQPVSLLDFSESLAQFEKQAGLLQKQELKKASTEQLGWDIFTSLTQYGNLLCTIPGDADLTHVHFVSVTPDEEKSPFRMLAELKAAQTGERVLSQPEALRIQRQWEPPACKDVGVSEAALSEFAREIGLLSGDAPPLICKSLYFDRVLLSSILDDEFEATARHFK